MCVDGSSWTCDTGPVLNMYDPTRSTGGSSAGSAAAVSCYMFVPFHEDKMCYCKIIYVEFNLSSIVLYILNGRFCFFTNTLSLL